MDIDKTVQSLQRKGYEVSQFETKEEAVEYLHNTIKDKTIGFGGSQTLTNLNLRNVLAENNTVYAPDFPHDGEDMSSTLFKAANTELFFLSANAVSEDGDIVNIDAGGNRIAGSVFGHKKIYYIVGQNKIGGTLEEAVHRARNIACPKNALRFHVQTPCTMAVVSRLQDAFKEKFGVDCFTDQLKWESFIEGLDESELGTHCYDCTSPQRICASMMIHMIKPLAVEAEVVIIHDKLGF